MVKHMGNTSVKWTPMQKAAIELKDRTMLISAAAGSGKTAVLTERIIERLCDPQSPGDISRMLIVTFTKAAASELKTRISKAIAEAAAQDGTNTHLRRQLLLLPSAKISTIHSFCFDVIKRNIKALELPDGLGVANETEMAILSRELMDEIIDCAYSEVESERLGIKDISALSDIFARGGTDRSMCDSLISLYGALGSYPDGIEFLKLEADRILEDSEKSFLKTRHGGIILSHLAAHAEYLKKEYERISEAMRGEEELEKYIPIVCDELSLLTSLHDELNCALAENIKKRLRSFEFVRLPSLKRGYASELANEFKEARAQLKDFIRGELTPIIDTDQETLSHISETSAKLLYDAYALLKAFDDAFSSEKRKLAKLDFADLERYAYKLLVSNGEPTETARELAREYDEIYIDEYQDTNAIQDLIFKCVARDNNRFMVGDIKQSIYSFRGAAPESFAHYRDSFEPYTSDSISSNAPCTIFLSDNFRCDYTVTSFCNTIFSSLFKACGGGVNYCDSDDLVCSKAGGKDMTVPVKIVLAKKQSDDDDGYICEAEYIAGEVKRLLSSEKRKDGKPISPGDIAILVRAKNASVKIEEALRSLGIPTSNDIETEFFEKPEILLVMSLLNVIDDPLRDIYLAGALRSPIFNFTLDELITIRAYKTEGALYDALCAYTDATLFEKGRDFIKRLEHFRAIASGSKVDRLISRLYRECSLFAIVANDASSKHKSDDAREDLMLLYKYARDFEGSSFKGLSSFIHYVEDIIAQKKKLKGASSKAASGKAVEIMTIHRSKGLEFPVVFLAASQKTTDAKGNEQALLTHRHAGASIDLPALYPGTKFKTLHREALEISLDEDRYEEELRVLYVALTRARERLYVTGEFKDPAAEYDKAKRLSTNICRYTIMHKLSYMQLVLMPVLASSMIYEKGCEVIFPQRFVDEAAYDVSEEAANTYKRDSRELEALKERMSYRYPFAELGRIPSKLSVSELSEDVLDLGDERATDNDYEKRLCEKLAQRKPKLMMSSLERAPSAADIGTATHVFMQFCDLEAIERRGIEHEIARMLSLGYISCETAEMIDRDAIKRFFASELYKSEIKSGKKIRREYRFNVKFPAACFTRLKDKREALRGESIFVQGIIDCFTENDDGSYTVIDYKTDACTASAEVFERILAQRHAPQLTYYMCALEMLTKKKVTRVLIYSFALGRAIDITDICKEKGKDIYDKA